MKSRKRSREVALQILYQIEYDAKDFTNALKDFRAQFEAIDIDWEFVQTVVRGVSDHKVDIDTKVRDASQNWKPERMPLVDLNILRLGAYELVFPSDVAPQIAINEAVELAKKFGTTDSAAFVNGVLDRVRKSHAP